MTWNVWHLGIENHAFSQLWWRFLLFECCPKILSCIESHNNCLGSNIASDSECSYNDVLKAVVWSSFWCTELKRLHTTGWLYCVDLVYSVQWWHIVDGYICLLFQQLVALSLMIEFVWAYVLPIIYALGKQSRYLGVTEVVESFI